MNAEYIAEDPSRGELSGTVTLKNIPVYTDEVVEFLSSSDPEYMLKLDVPMYIALDVNQDISDEDELDLPLAVTFPNVFKSISATVNVKYDYCEVTGTNEDGEDIEEYHYDQTNAIQSVSATKDCTGLYGWDYNYCPVDYDTNNPDDSIYKAGSNPVQFTFDSGLLPSNIHENNITVYGEKISVTINATIDLVALCQQFNNLIETYGGKYYDWEPRMQIIKGYEIGDSNIPNDANLLAPKFYIAEKSS